MSRVAKAPVVLPQEVEVVLSEGNISVKGKLGQLTATIHPQVEVKQVEGELLFLPRTQAKTAWAMAGTTRALVNNMVHGVSSGFTMVLELSGVGYRAQLKGTSVSLALGFSHPVEYALPAAVTAEMPNNTTIVLKSSNKQVLGQVAAEIRAFRKPEPYKGKGVRRAGEKVRIKETKKK